VGEDDLLQGVGALVWEADSADLRFIFVSKHAEKLLGYRSERLTADHSAWGEHVHPGDRERALAECRLLLRERRDGELEYRAVTAGGEVIWVRDSLSVNGTTVRGVMLDITDRVLSEREARFHSRLLDEVDAAVVATDLKGTVSHWNRHAERMFGFTREEALGRNIAELRVVDDPAFVSRKMRVLREGRAFEGEFRARRRDGTNFACYTHDAPITEENGELNGFVGVAEDITARKNAEKAIA
jgi:PAS domain S-box-containing protein